MTDQVDSCIEEARNFERIGRLREAEDLYRVILSKEPGLVVPRIRLASLIGDSPVRLREAVLECQKARAIAPASSLVLSLMGALLKKSKRYEEAKVCLQSALDLRFDADDMLSLAACCGKLGHYRLQRDLILKIRNVDPTNLDAIFYNACNLMYKVPRDAEVQFRLLLELNSSYAEGWLWLGYVQYTRGMYPDSLMAINTFLASKPHAFWGLLMLSVLQFRSGQYLEANYSLRRALVDRERYAPHDVPGLLRTAGSPGSSDSADIYFNAVFCFARYDLDEASQMLSVIREFLPVGTLLCAIRAEILIDEMDPIESCKLMGDGQLADHISVIEDAVLDAPDLVAAQEFLGGLYYRCACERHCRDGTLDPNGEILIERAIGQLRRAVALDPKEPYSRLWMGLCSLKLGDNINAEQELRLGFQFGIDGAFGAYLGQFLSNSKRFEEADAVFRQTHLNFPDSADAWRRHADRLVFESRLNSDPIILKQSLLHYRRAIQEEPGHAHTHFLLGCALCEIGGAEIAEAIYHLKLCLDLEPLHKKAQERLDGARSL